MSSTKYLLGTAALAGGVYYYDRNVQPIIPRNQQQLDKDIQKAKKKESEFSNKVVEKYDDSIKKLKEQPSISEKIKDSKKYQNLASDAREYKGAVQEAATPDEDKNIFVRATDKYIDTINSIGNANKTTTDLSTVSRRKEIKQESWSDWFSGKNKTAEEKLKEAEDQLEAKSKSWFNWGSKKADDASNELKASKKDLNAKKNEWLNWGSRKSDEISDKAYKDYVNAKDSSEAQKNEWVNWGSKKSDEISKDISSHYDSSKKAVADTKNNLTQRFNIEKQRAIDNYEKAKANLDEMTEKFKKSTEPDKEVKLQRAEADFHSSLRNLKAYGDDLYNEASNKLKNITK